MSYTRLSQEAVELRARVLKATQNTSTKAFVEELERRLKKKEEELQRVTPDAEKEKEERLRDEFVQWRKLYQTRRVVDELQQMLAVQQWSKEMLARAETLMQLLAGDLRELDAFKAAKSKRMQQELDAMRVLHRFASTMLLPVLRVTTT